MPTQVRKPEHVPLVVSHFCHLGFLVVLLHHKIQLFTRHILFFQLEPGESSLEKRILFKEDFIQNIVQTLDSVVISYGSLHPPVEVGPQPVEEESMLLLDAEQIHVGRPVVGVELVLPSRHFDHGGSEIQRSGT